jgi:phage tail protein X
MSYLPPQTPPPTQPIPAGARIYTSVQGDWWDLIALRVYGMRRFDELYLHKLMEANYEIREINEFPAGIPVVVPPMPVKTVIPLVPWTNAYIVTNP